MDRETVQANLDDLVERIKKSKEQVEILPGAFAVASLDAETILVYEHIKEIADVMGIQLDEYEVGDIEFPYRYSFIYKGEEFIGYEKKRLSGYGDTK